MSQSNNVTISVKVPIAWESMAKRKKQRLRQIVGRDTRLIRYYLGVIEAHERELLRGKKKERIDQTKLDTLTLTAFIVKKGNSKRLTVMHDIKTRFPRISTNEIQECRQTAVSIYESYLVLRKKKWLRTTRPCHATSSRRIPRWVFSLRFKLVEHRTDVARWWLDLRDSFDSTPQGRKIHDRLLIPLKTSPFHLSQLERGVVKALQIFTDKENKWWITFAVRIQNPEQELIETPPNKAVLGIDLGMKKAACTSLITEKKVSETRYFSQKDKISLLERYDHLVAELQRKLDTKRNSGQKYDEVVKRLKSLRTKRENVAREYDRVLVRQLLDYIDSLSMKYSLFVALGRVKGIRNRARRGNGKLRKFRGLIHNWAFRRISRMLKHGLAQLGWKTEGKDSKFYAIPEQWTSIKCWKCGRRGIRLKQPIFICPTCGFRTNADRNGSLNIARRLITLISSLNETGLGRWSIPERAPAPKAARKTSSSKQKSSLSRNDRTSSQRESAAVRITQLSLLSFSNKPKMSDNDPAVEKTMENLSVAGSDAPAARQEREARTVGGTVCQ